MPSETDAYRRLEQEDWDLDELGGKGSFLWGA